MYGNGGAVGVSLCWRTQLLAFGDPSPPPALLRTRRLPSGSRLNSMNTRFQISSTLGSSRLTRSGTSRPPMRS